MVCQCTDLLQLKECLVRAHRATCFSSSCNLLVKNIHQQQSEHMVQIDPVAPYARDGGHDRHTWTAGGESFSMKHPIAAEAWAAAARIGAAVHQTPVQASAWLSGATGAPAFLKLETQQVWPLPEAA